jgi:hypothetical protein
MRFVANKKFFLDPERISGKRKGESSTSFFPEKHNKDAFEYLERSHQAPFLLSHR